MAVQPPPVPDELRQDAIPVAIRSNRTSDFDQIGIFVNAAALELPDLTLGDLRDVVSVIHFEAGMVVLARLAAKVSALRRQRVDQLRLARGLFPSPWIEQIEAFLNQHPNADLFSEQQITILQRLLVEHGADGTLPYDLSRGEGLWLVLVLVCCGSLATATAESLGNGRTLPDWLAYFVQNGAYHARPWLQSEAVRAHEMYVRIARDPSLRGHDKYCPLDQWMLEDHGFSLEEQFALGFTLAAMAHSFDDDWEAGDRTYLSAVHVQDLFVKLGWEGREEEALALISADRETLAAEFAAGDNTEADVAWERRPFMRRPFLRCADGALILHSPRAVASWLTDGYHYRLLDAAQRRSKDDPKGRVSTRYGAFAGVLLERYVLDAVQQTFGDRPAGGGRVYGEQPYTTPDGMKMTSDVAIDLGFDLVLIEVSVSRLRGHTLLLGKTDAVKKDLKRLLVDKVLQLDRVITDLIFGVATIPEREAELHMERVRRVWPIVLSAGSVMQNNVLWDFLAKQTQGALQQAKVQPLTILDPEDLETLLGLVENGHNLVEVLRHKTEEEFRGRELAVCLRNHPQMPADRVRPERVGQVFLEFTDQALALFDFDKGLPPAVDEAA